MPDFIFTSPDGLKHKVTGPEGSTPEQAFKILQGQLGGQEDVGAGQATQPAAPQGKPNAVMDFIKSIPGAAIRGLTGTASGLGTMAQAEMGQQQGAPIPSQEKVGEQLTGGLPQPQTGLGKIGAAAVEGVTNPISYIGGAGSMGAKAFAGAASGAGGEIAGQLTNENPVARFIGGALGGAAGPGMVKGAAKAADPGRQAAVKTLEEMGVKPSAGDVTGSRTLQEAERLGDVMGGGGSYKAVKDAPIIQYTHRALEKMGEKPAAHELATPDVIERAHDRIGATMEKAAAKLPVKFDQQLVDDLDNIEREVQQLRIPEAPQVTGLIDSIVHGFQPPAAFSLNQMLGAMEGKTYQALTRYTSPFGRAIHGTNDNVAHYATKLREALDNALERTAKGPGGSRTNLKRLKEARKQWYNMLVVSKSVSGPGEEAAQGMVLPDRLRQNVASGPDGKLNYAAGRGDLHDLARAGARVISPYSSTRPEVRHAMRGAGGAVGGVLGSLATGNPIHGGVAGAAIGAALPGFIGRATNSPIGQWLLKHAHDQRSRLASSQLRKNQPSVALSAIRGGAIGEHGRKEPRRPTLYEE